SQAWLWHVVVPLTASCLFLANYPANSHACQQAIRSYTIHEDVHVKFLTETESEFIRLYNSNKPPISVVELHLECLRSLHTRFPELKSNKSCFCCLMRSPEKVFDCAHAVCDTCIKTVGKRSRTSKFQFIISLCPLCGHSNQDDVFQFIPPTAGIRMLSIDGGGVRGIAPLKFLEYFDSALNEFGCCIRDAFDYVCGTSTGGLISLGLMTMRWPIQECVKNFEHLALQTFKHGNKSFLSLAGIQHLLLSYINDYRYDSSAIEQIFRSTENTPVKMFNPLRCQTKVAVTTTTARGTMPCLIANYNGLPRSPTKGSYQVIRALDSEHDMTISDAQSINFFQRASCTSAAPWYFRPKFLRNLGTYQDGGLRHNNPIDIGYWETRCLWPDKADPDFVLSLGTGMCSNSITVGPQSPVNRRFAYRLLDTLMKTMDGEDAWRRFKLSLPRESQWRYHRLNVTFTDLEPTLDDVQSMEGIKDKVSLSLKVDSEVPRILDSILASMFYFELVSTPTFSDGQYLCEGMVYCRMELNKEGTVALYNALRRTSSYFLFMGSSFPCVERVPRGAPPYGRRLRFSVATLNDIICISILGITSKPRMLSGLPRSVSNLIEAQGLYAPFGTADHVAQKPLPTVPSKRKFEDTF
ncbi:FabD/lysophospholipase-like protein, partial [Patellaria atrata CBS 101060]